jgi:cytoskeletal protein CcmA (bactofilin family)
MFSKSKESPAAPNAVPATRTGRNAAPSIISADLIVTGTLVSNGDIQIEGVVEGDVRSAGLVIGEKAQIRGEIQADDITVRGRVVGRIHGRKVQLAATSHVEGDILHEAFSVEAGAFFEGSCRHSDNPLGDEARKPVVQQSAPAQQPALGMARTGLAGLDTIGLAPIGAAPLGLPAE